MAAAEEIVLKEQWLRICIDHVDGWVGLRRSVGGEWSRQELQPGIHRTTQLARNDERLWVRGPEILNCGEGLELRSVDPDVRLATATELMHLVEKKGDVSLGLGGRCLLAVGSWLRNISDEHPEECRCFSVQLVPRPDGGRGSIRLLTLPLRIDRRVWPGDEPLILVAARKPA
ncbi:MAG: hypothetical protein ABIJ46_03545 [bacterium]